MPLIVWTIFLGKTFAYRDEVKVVRAIRAFIHGRVQGVFFRVYTRDKAHKLNLVGWVRNNRNGTVECQVQGPDAAIEKFIQFLHHGSPSARVDNVSITNVEFDPNLHDFKITY
ncbi:MAG: acylphosphatase [Promethearchaeota archaeon]